MLSLLCACGARTGLRVPDGGTADAGITVRRDGSARDSETPHDASSPDAGPTHCIDVPSAGGPVRADLALPVTLRDVDVLFVVDGTGSIQDQVETIGARLRTVVLPGIQAALPNAWLGLAYSGEFPYRPYGPPSIHPYGLALPITSDVLALEGPLGRSPNWGNDDVPESQVEAMYQSITGEGLGSLVAPAFGCPPRQHGGACFRDDAISVIVLVADAPFHDGPPGAPPEAPYDLASFPSDVRPHEYADLLRVAGASGVHVVALGVVHAGMDSPMPHLVRVATDTGALDADGSVLAFDVGDGSSIDTSLVDAIQRLAGGLPVDVSAHVEDVPGDAVDVTTLVTSIRPLGAEPASGARAITPDAFLGVRPGTRVTFELVVDTSSLPATPATQRYPARVVFVAEGRSVLDTVDVVIEIPGADGMHCP